MSDNPMTEAEALDVLKRISPDLYAKLTAPPAPVPQADTVLPLPHPPIYASKPQRSTVHRVAVARNVQRPKNLAYHILTNATHNTQHLAGDTKQT